MVMAVFSISHIILEPCQIIGYIHRFVSGPVESKWGALRAQQGHPAPWNLTYFAIGNEVRYAASQMSGISRIGTRNQ